MLVNPLDVAICERRFSKQNASHLRDSLKLDTLNGLMRVSLCKIEVGNLDWREVSAIWHNMKNLRTLSLNLLL